MGRWVFEELRGAAVRREPSEAVLFRTEQTGEGEYAGNDALVREILQNSLDAGSGDGPVRVRLAIYEPADAPPQERLAYYFERLREPLTARQFEFDPHGVPRSPCRFFVCEDFGTRGLEGDIELFQDPPPADKSRQDFYWFWRNIGRSGKTGDDLGRWGLGKTVYRAASRVGCMLGLTVRKSDQKMLLMGQAVLQIHRHENKEYMPEGYWCAKQNDQGLPLPIDDPEELQHFIREWQLTRRNEPGLSVVVPFVPDELKADRILQAVAVHFFTRILREELVVELMGPGLDSVTLDKSGIAAACSKVTWDGPKRTKRHVPPPIEFARRCLEVTQFVETHVLGQRSLPDLTNESFQQEELTKARHLFSAGELTSLRVPIWLPRRKGDGEQGHVDVYLQRLSDGARCDTYYVREGMTITKINSRSAQRGIQALVNVEPGPLAKLLGDTEGPAHEDWDTSADRPDLEWKTWKGRVKFVRGIVDALVEVLTPPTTQADFDLLSDFFSVERTSGSQRQKKPGEETLGPTAMEPVVSQPTWFQITERAGGFTIRRNANVPMPASARLKVAIAYDLPRGDPLRNWNSIDFRIGNNNGDLKPRGKGLKARLLAGNILLLDQIQEDFSFTVSGFDRHRDLFVRVDDLSNTEENVP
jgi:hypothetical protein